jgi:pyruvate/2-oxoglutarate dehydrogenase complex dihydrolipoamide acyltransferase (E2) component
MLVRACDIDKKIPAKNYTITADDGRTISKDLCVEHAEPFEEWLEEAELGEEEAEEEPEEQPEPLHEAGPEPEPESAPVVPKRGPRKVAAKKATAKKAATPARRRPKIVTLDEIEASKKR